MYDGPDDNEDDVYVPQETQTQSVTHPTDHSKAVTPVGRVAPLSLTCPQCGEQWDGVLCIICHHEGPPVEIR